MNACIAGHRKGLLRDYQKSVYSARAYRRGASVAVHIHRCRTDADNRKFIGGKIFAHLFIGACGEFYRVAYFISRSVKKAAVCYTLVIALRETSLADSYKAYAVV